MLRRFFGVSAVSLLALLAWGVLKSGITPGGALAYAAPAGKSKNSGEQRVPAYHPRPPHGRVPGTLDPKQFQDPIVRNAYAMAGQIREILYQQPCYCNCDKIDGHKSLLDCFRGTHGSICGICQQEAIYAYRGAQKGRDAAQIRASIVGGDWRSVDLTQYKSAPDSQ
jgi:uncharacterized protein with PCYCGC motif